MGGTLSDSGHADVSLVDTLQLAVLLFVERP